MEVQEKHRLEILNAKCNYVCAVDILQKKMSYGEDVTCCINKLFLASRIINRLECYCFDSIPLGTEKVMSVFTLTYYVFEYNSSYPSGTIGQIIVNGIQLYSATAAGTINGKDAISALLIGINYDYSLTSGGGIYTFVVTAEPNIRTITVMLTNPSGNTTIHNLKLNTVGVPSTTECNNCIEDSNLIEMYALLNQLLS